MKHSTDLDAGINKWGQDVHKMRFRAFKVYDKNYRQGVKEYPEFQAEYDAEKSLKK